MPGQQSARPTAAHHRVGVSPAGSRSAQGQPTRRGGHRRSEGRLGGRGGYGSGLGAGYWSDIKKRSKINPLLSRKSMQVLNRLTQSALLAAVAFSNSCPAQAMETRRCGLMLNGKIQSIETCSYRESNSTFLVRTNNATYRLDTSGSTPNLSINGKRTSAGGGAYSSSSSRECDLFIALSDQREDFNMSYSNFPKGLCVLQKSN
jgi:hypothetical protein